MGTQKDPRAALKLVTLRCVGGPKDGRLIVVRRERRSHPLRIRNHSTVTYRLATIATYDGDFSFLTPQGWSDADALRYLFGEPD